MTSKKADPIANWNCNSEDGEPNWRLNPIRENL